MNITKTEQMLLEKNGKAGSLRDAAINQKIRRKYSLSNELAILRQRDEKPEEFAIYNAYVEECKAEVDAEAAEEVDA